MGRPNQSAARRSELLPRVAATFAEHGYRRTTTALLAERCAVQEVILYRLWADKRSMFLAAIEFVATNAEAIWARQLDTAADDPRTAAEIVLDYEAEHLGEFGFYRILFAGLSETDDPQITAGLRDAYRRFQAFLRARTTEHRAARAGAGRRRAGSASGRPDADATAWALLGLGTVVNLARELDLLPPAERAELLRRVGRLLLAGS